MLRPEEKSFLRSLVHLLNGIKEQVESVTENIQAQADARENEDPPKPIHLSAELHLPSEVENYYKSKAAKKPRWKPHEGLTLTISVLTLVAVVAYACITLRQWRTMHDTYLEIQKQTKLSDRNERLEQRAWISVHAEPFVLTTGNYADVPIQVINTGRTPATHVEGQIISTVMLKNERLDTSYAVGHIQNAAAAGTIHPGHPEVERVRALGVYNGKTMNLMMSPPAISEINAGRQFVVTFGRLTYLDIFGKDHWVTFCMAGSGIPVGSITGCSEYNDVDQEKDSTEK